MFNFCFNLSFLSKVKVKATALYKAVKAKYGRVSEQYNYVMKPVHMYIYCKFSNGIVSAF